MADAVRRRARPGKKAKPESVEEGSESDRFIEKFHKATGSNQIIRSAILKPRFTHLPTNIFSLDFALGGGIPESLITLVFGWESTGKTTLAQRVIAEAQRKNPDKKAVLVDVEGTYADAWGAVHGIDNEALRLAQPETGEQALDITVGLLKADDVSLIVVDSLAAISPVKEMEESLGDHQVGLQGKLLAKFFRQTAQTLIAERKRGHLPTLLLTNQWRMKIGVMHGDPRVLPGGTAQNYFASCRIETFNKETTGNDAYEVPVVLHSDLGWKIKKNKVTNGPRAAEARMVRDPSNERGAGFILEGPTVVTYARKFGIITGGGSSWRIEDVDEKFRTIDSMGEYMHDNPEFCHEMKRRLIGIQRQNMGLNADGWY